MFNFSKVGLKSSPCTILPMLFNSFAFIFGFLPALLIVVYGLRRTRMEYAHVAMIAASLLFYGMLDFAHLWVLLASALINYLVGSRLAHRILSGKGGSLWLVVGVGFNLALLGGYKYIAFVAGLFGIDFPAVAAPLGISFFTFHQLAYLIDIYRRRIVPTGMRDYALYVTFFPHLIAGPIMRYGQFAPQLRSPYPSPAIAAGIFFFSVGLFKKTVLADTFAPIADRVFAAAASEQGVGFWEAWKGVLAYTWQIYFDFSGYAEMAIGLGLLVGIALPVNFDSPYKAVSIVDFWRRWHITLSQFLRDYVYIPLGGSRHGRLVHVGALLLTMTMAGLWHGAALTFVVWGALHGAFLALVHLWRATVGRFIRLPAFASVALTFVTVSALWVLFRAETFEGALSMYASMLAYAPLSLPTNPGLWFTDPAWREWLWIGAALAAVFGLRSTPRYAGYDRDTPSSERLRVGLPHAFVSGILLWIAFKTMTLEPSRSFVYFVF